MTIKSIFRQELLKQGYLFVVCDFKLVKYRPGGFFVTHKDNSSGANDCTFIYCVKPCSKGGETRLVIESEHSQPDELLVKQTAGDMLIFDKSIAHSGQLVLGETDKIIIKGNCVRMPRETEEVLLEVD